MEAKDFTITITVAPTKNAKVARIGAGDEEELCVGRAQTRAVLKRIAGEQIDALVKELFPAKGE